MFWSCVRNSSNWVLGSYPSFLSCWNGKLRQKRQNHETASKKRLFLWSEIKDAWTWWLVNCLTLRSQAQRSPFSPCLEFPLKVRAAKMGCFVGENENAGFEIKRKKSSWHAVFSLQCQCIRVCVLWCLYFRSLACILDWNFPGWLRGGGEFLCWRRRSRKESSILTLKTAFDVSHFPDFFFDWSFLFDWPSIMHNWPPPVAQGGGREWIQAVFSWQVSCDNNIWVHMLLNQVVLGCAASCYSHGTRPWRWLRELVKPRPHRARPRWRRGNAKGLHW